MPSIIQITPDAEFLLDETSYWDQWIDVELFSLDGRRLVVSGVREGTVWLDVCECSVCRPKHLKLTDEDVADLLPTIQSLSGKGAAIQIVPANRIWPSIYNRRGGPVRGY